MPCEFSLEWLSVPYSLPWNAASHRPLPSRNSLHSYCPLLYIAWQAASSIASRWPYIQRCGLICDSQSWAVGIRPRSSLTCCAPIYRTGTCFPSLFVIVTPKILSLMKFTRRGGGGHDGENPR